MNDESTSIALPVKPNKLFSTDTHFHIKKALRNQGDILLLAHEGDEEAIAVRNIILNTMKEVCMTKTEAMILRYYLSSIHTKEVMWSLLDDQDTFTKETRSEYLEWRREFHVLDKKKTIIGEERLRKEELKALCKEKEFIVEQVAEQLLNRMKEAYHKMENPSIL